MLNLIKAEKRDLKENILRLRNAINEADAIVIGAGAGLSTSAGYIYTGERFEKYFSDFIKNYGFEDMYSGGFYPYPSKGEFWAFWSRYIWINRYTKTPKPVYEELLDLVKDKDYFVITTNVDHCFQKAGFDKKRLFYTQGDYGLFQCSKPCHQKTYDNEEIIRKMVLSQGFSIGEENELIVPENRELKMSVPEELFPVCPVCGEPMTMNLRSDDLFVQDEGWDEAAQRYSDFLRRHQDMKILFLELAVGFNTPVIIKVPFIQMTERWKNATYACLNYGEAYTTQEIEERSICIDGDIGTILEKLK
ncbi:MAG: Sir2 silent information regulator family NAD-dependent deacetylase [Erysipelotrichaceae bacterium]|nr:Sir2 silent information regulator family NAD-dependent deacetylase [Erysipelotrichaceae bacterium]